nr:MAG TPA: hypothetical protein [Caudoviricetes sp.]
MYNYCQHFFEIFLNFYKESILLVGYKKIKSCNINSFI